MGCEEASPVATLPWKLEAVGPEACGGSRPSDACAARLPGAKTGAKTARLSTRAETQVRMVLFPEYSEEIKVDRLTAGRLYLKMVAGFLMRSKGHRVLKSSVSEMGRGGCRPPMSGSVPIVRCRSRMRDFPKNEGIFGSLCWR